MEIRFKKLSEKEHELTVVRPDGSTGCKVLNSRSFLRHDLAHLAAESCLEIDRGYWGLVAKGAALDDDALEGPDLMRAERFAGPIQTLMRLEASQEKFHDVLSRIEPDTMTRELSDRIHEQCRQLTGHLKATPYGGEMVQNWKIPVSG